MASPEINKRFHLKFVCNGLDYFISYVYKPYIHNQNTYLNKPYVYIQKLVCIVIKQMTFHLIKSTQLCI